jgi:hypothetical protein
MQARLISNPTRSALYLGENDFVLRTFDEAASRISHQTSDFANFIESGLFYGSVPGAYRSVGGHYLVPPRTCWQWENGRLEYVRENIARPAKVTASEHRLAQIVRRYTRLLKGRRVAVELSGGLDSSIVYGALRKAGIDVVLIGFCSRRYEFRTELHVQEILSRGCKESIMLDGDAPNLFANLKSIPRHPLPSPSALFYVRHQQLCDAARSASVDLVLTGSGGDTLFIEPAYPNAEAFSDRVHGWTFNDDWSQDTVYSRSGIEHYCAYSPAGLTRVLLGLRSSQQEDRMKLWARNFFSGLLPRELVTHAYKASHSGLYAESLHRERETVEELMAAAYNRTRIEEFHPGRTLNSLESWAELPQPEQQGFLSRLSFSVWLNSATGFTLS